MDFFPFLAEAAASADGETIGNLIGVLILLLGLELVPGVDNILVISIMVSRLPEEQQNLARNIGLVLALVARIILLFAVTWLLKLSTPIGEDIPWLGAQGWLYYLAVMSPKDLILFAGGAFLLYKAVKEIHHVVEFHEDTAGPKKTYNAFGAAITPNPLP